MATLRGAHSPSCRFQLVHGLEGGEQLGRRAVGRQGAPVVTGVGAISERRPEQLRLRRPRGTSRT